MGNSLGRTHVSVRSGDSSSDRRNPAVLRPHQSSYCDAGTEQSSEDIFMKQSHKEENADILKGWQQIVEFLGQPVSVAERWAREGMPVERKGRFVEASREQLGHWLGRGRP